MLPASLLVAALAVAYGAPAHADIIVNIDKNSQSMTVTVDGEPRYIWPVSTGRPGYDTPNGTFRPNRMDAEHLSQEWDNAPMPHTIFFDLHGHAIHGFRDTSHIGSAASHGCVRLEADHAATLYQLVAAEGMKETTVVISGRTPTGPGPAVARRAAPVVANVALPLQVAPRNGEQDAADGQPLTLFGALFGQQPAANAQQPTLLAQPQPAAYGQRQLYYLPRPYYMQQLSNGQRVYYVQPGYQQQPQQPQYQPYPQD
jgi:L,D-transpeptidase catalytic domain